VVPNQPSAGTTAVVVATAATADGRPAALLAFRSQTLLSHLLGQLQAAGVDTVHVITRSAWTPQVARHAGTTQVHAAADLRATLAMIGDLAARAEDGLLLANGEVALHGAALEGLLFDPRVATGVLVAPDVSGPSAWGVRLVRGQVVAAESPYHLVVQPTAAFLGLVKAGPAGSRAVAEVGRQLTALLADGLPGAWASELASKAARFHGDQAAELAGEAAPDDAVALLLVGLVRGGEKVGTVDLRALVWARPLTAAAVAEVDAALDRVDEDGVRLASSVKAQDGFFTTYFVSPYSPYLVRWAARRGMTPNQVTVASLLLGIVAALAFATGSRAGLVAGAALLLVAFVTDCVDGQLARYRHQYSTLGSWLDSTFDRGKEFLAYAGLAIGGVRAGDDVSLWALATAALAVQISRHSIDFAYASQVRSDVVDVPAVALLQPDERPPGDRARWRATLTNSTVAGALADEEDALVDVVAGQAPTAAEPPASGSPGPHKVPATDNAARHTVGLAGVRASVALERQGLKWLKRILVLPIGERFALIAITAAVFSPRVTFTALLVWGGLAAVYTTTGRVLRSWV
jgi:phosphatidylglycerophosphate synthase